MADSRRKRRRKYRRYPFLSHHIILLVVHYSTLTTRFLFYLLVSRFPSLYPNDRRTYKAVVWRSTKLRRADPKLNQKFIDPTRQFIEQHHSYHLIEIFTEKASLLPMIVPLAKLYGVNVLVLRGFGSLSAITRALKRAIARGIKLILYIGDWDPSGLEIEEVCRRETGIEFKRVMVTKEQAAKLKLIPLPTNKKDSRWRRFVQKHGDEGYEVEAIRPRTFRRLLEESLREAVPASFLEERKLKKRVSKFARPYLARLGRKMEADIRKWVNEGVSKEEIRRRLQRRYGL